MVEIATQTRNYLDHDRRWVIYFAIFVMVLTSLPYLIGYSVQDEAWRFSGFIINVEDGNSYIGKMLRGSTGDWLFRTPYTSFPQKGVLVFLPYLLLGKLASPPGLHDQLVALYNLFRIGAGTLMILATYDFISTFLGGRWNKRIAIVFATLGGGLGWLLILLEKENWLGSLPLEFYSPETFGFLSLYSFPHLALARACMLWGFTLFIKASMGSYHDERYLRGAAICGFFWFLGGLAQPLIIVVVGAISGGYLVVTGFVLYLKKSQANSEQKESWLRAAKFVIVAGAIPFPLVLYNYWILKTDSFVQLWTKQNLILSPHPLHYVIAFGALIPFVVIGARYILREKPSKGWFLITWSLLLPIFAYLPVNLQRRLPDGIWVVLVTLTFYGLEQVDFLQKWKRGISYSLGCLIFPSTLMLWIGGMNVAWQKVQPVFQPVDKVKVFSFLSANAAQDSVILTSFDTGNVLPAWAPLRVVVGHGPESVNLETLREEVSNFYQQDECDRECRDFLRNNKIRYAIWGPEERAIGTGEPGEMSNTHLAFSQGDYQVYEILPIE